MTLSNAYLTLPELRSKLDIGDTNISRDSELERLGNSASRWIDRYCGRRFYGRAETHAYTADDCHVLMVDDLTSISTLKTDEDSDGVYETTWSAGSYNLQPYNAPDDEKPYTMIEVSAAATQSFPARGRKAVQIYGMFGYVAGTAAATACPDVIHDAALLIAERWFRRKDAPFGVAGNMQLGVQPVRTPSLTVDPDIVAMLDPYRRYV